MINYNMKESVIGVVAVVNVVGAISDIVYTSDLTLNLNRHKSI